MHDQTEAVCRLSAAGEVLLSGELSPIGPLLYIGQRTLSGKLASFGLGHYERSIDSNLRKDQQTA